MQLWMLLKNKVFADYVNETFGENAYRGTSSHKPSSLLIDPRLLSCPCWRWVSLHTNNRPPSRTPCSVPTIIPTSWGYHHHGTSVLLLLIDVPLIARRHRVLATWKSPIRRNDSNVWCWRRRWKLLCLHSITRRNSCPHNGMAPFRYSLPMYLTRHLVFRYIGYHTVLLLIFHQGMVSVC